METALLIAIIAAAASLTSAIVSGRSARSARLSASKTLNVNHKVAAIDRDSDELRNAFQAVAERLGTHGGSGQAYVGSVLGALESLMACRAADDEIEKYASMLQNQVASRSAAEAAVSIKDVRIAYTACQKALEATREATLGGR